VSAKNEKKGENSRRYFTLCVTKLTNRLQQEGRHWKKIRENIIGTFGVGCITESIKDALSSIFENNIISLNIGCVRITMVGVDARGKRVLRKMYLLVVYENYLVKT